MIFATDLDRTLIYSKGFLEGVEVPCLNVEIYKEEPISYITEEAIRLLKEVNRALHLIPVTTRNLEQYKRITLFSEFIEPEIYIVNNGGTIFYKNQEDLEWSQRVIRKIEQLSISYDQVLQGFLQVYKGPVERHKKSDDLIWLVLGDKDHIHWESIQVYKEQIAALGWNLDVNGRKIYLYPSFIRKWEALSYVRQKYYNEPMLCAGDSLFDLEMMQKADDGIMPCDAGLNLSGFDEALKYETGSLDKVPAVCKPIKTTQKTGIRAAEDILSYALQQACSIDGKNCFTEKF